MRFQPRSANAFFDSLGGLVALHERFLVVRQSVDLDRSGEAAGALLADGGDTGMIVVGRAVDLLGLELDVLLEDLLDGEATERLAVGGAELDDVADRALEIGRERDRDRPDLSGCRGACPRRPTCGRPSP